MNQTSSSERDDAVLALERRQALHALATRTRDLIEVLVDSEADLATIESAAESVRELTSRIDAFGHRAPFTGFAESANAGESMLESFLAEGGMPPAHFDHSPLIGLANPIAPPLKLRIEDGRVVGEAVFGSAYEGPPGCVHGGMLAAAFDELLGMTQSLSGSPGMTGRLTVHYRSPTPLRAIIRWEGELLSVSGRKILTQGRSFTERDGEWQLTAEAEGLFISIPRDRFQQMAAARDGQLP